MDTITKTHSNAPKIFPLPWADQWGQDKYGIWMTFTIKGISQRMRWIKPGQFKMGSPEEEKERDNDETPHDVILTDGFWLADTACTQALWGAVMEKDPSEFKGTQHPVENVGWEDCQEFIDKINQLKPGLDLCLPSEAQWEYACRAGTETPFWFGENITPEQVNCNWKYTYAGGKKGIYRGETVDVKSLPCNGWGLYQMHGNVWEWCSDWYGDYSPDTDINSMGPDTGAVRVCRGGSWFCLGGDARSYIRNWEHPTYRNGDLGFRLAQVNQARGPGGARTEAGTAEPGRGDGAKRNR